MTVNNFRKWIRPENRRQTKINLRTSPSSGDVKILIQPTWLAWFEYGNGKFTYIWWCTDETHCSNLTHPLGRHTHQTIRDNGTSARWCPGWLGTYPCHLVWFDDHCLTANWPVSNFLIVLTIQPEKRDPGFDGQKEWLERVGKLVPFQSPVNLPRSDEN